MSRHFHGLLSFPLTPFTTDGVNGAALEEHVRRQLQWGPGAMFVACGTGEFPSLSLPEYREVVGTAVRLAAGNTPVYAGAGGGPAIARDYARAATEAGVDGLLLLPPYLVAAPARGVVEYVRQVAAVTDRQVIVYQRANAAFDTASALSLLDIGNVVGIKDGRGDIDGMQRIVAAVRTSGHARAADFLFLNGLPTAEISATAYSAIGVEDYSSAVATFVPDIATAFHTALGAGDRATVDSLLANFYLPFAQLRDTVPGYAVALVKAGARLTGTDLGGVRPPLVDPTAEHEQQLVEIIHRGRRALA